MSKIKDYVRDNNITNADIVIGSDGDQNNVTKNFTVGGLKGFMLEDFQASNQDNLTKSFYFISDSLNNKASDELVSFINSSPSFEVEPTDVPLFKLIMGETLFLFTFSEIGKGNYGNGETQVTTGDLQLVSEFQLSYDVLDLDPNIKVFDLGDIQSSSISGQVNNLDPEIEIEELSEGFTLFLAIQDSVYKSWIYKGSSGLFGLNASKTSNNDFEEIKVSSNKISGLEAIDEGSGVGWRLIGRDPNNYGDIGEGAVDLSTSNSPSTTNGATGDYSFAEGSNTIASGRNSHAQGQGTQAIGLESHSEGDNSVASGVSSHAEGEFNFARSAGEHSGGIFGTDYTPFSPEGIDGRDRLVNYGNGTSPSNRSDAFTIYKNGAVRFYRDNIANINNSLKEGLFIYNTGDNNRPTIHDGNNWEGLAYKNELFDGDYNSLTNTPDLSVLNDTIVEPSLSDFPATGDDDKVYIASDTGYMYRWNGTGYTQLTDQTAIWGQISGNITDQTDLQNALNGKEDIFSKNTAFNKDFGTIADTVAEGDDSRIINGQTAFDWGNHADANYVDTFSTQDITGVKTFSSIDESLRIDAADVSGDDSVIRNASTSYNSSDSLNLLGFNPSGNLTASKPFGFGVELAWSLTDNRTYDLPDLSGTIALTSDLSDFVINSQLDDYVDRTTNQTVGGEKTFTSDVFINSDLGIGVSIPTARVDVNGDGRFRGSFSVDTSVTSPLFIGDLQGNADTATQLETSRQILLTGDATGSASFDGSADASITVEVQDDSHNHVISNIDGLQTALNNKLDTSTTLGNLEAIDEGNGIGYRIKGKDPNNYGNIGEGAVDLSTSTSPSTTHGALGMRSYAEGSNTKSLGFASHAEGSSTDAIGSNSHAEGQRTTSIGVNSHAEGEATEATSRNAHAEGNNTIAGANNSHAEGLFTEARGTNSHAEGDSTEATGQSSHAEGRSSVASGFSSHAEGQSSTASGNSSHAEGFLTEASGTNSHAEGRDSLASGDHSHAEGTDSFARSEGEHSGGVYGTDYTPQNDDTDRLVNYGNGTSTLARRDAFTIYKNGAVRFFRAALSSITNAVKEGMLIFDSDNNNRPTVHDGNDWEALAYKSDLDDYVDLTSNQTISGLKTFTDFLRMQNGGASEKAFKIGSDSLNNFAPLLFKQSTSGTTSQNGCTSIHPRSDNELRFLFSQPSGSTIFKKFSFLVDLIDEDNDNREYQMPNKSGTIALLDDFDINNKNLSLGENYANVKINDFVNDGFDIYPTDAGYQYAKLLQQNKLNDTKVLLLPQATKAGELGANKGSNFTASRATTATRVNENGLIESVAVNVPRIDYTNGNCPSILVETQRTNLINYSEELDNGSWIDSRGIVVTPNTDISPDGTTSADSLTTDGIDSGRITKGVAITTNQKTFTLSCFFKKTSTNQFHFLAANLSNSITFAVQINTATGQVIDGGSLISSTSGVTDKIGSKEINGYWRLFLTFTILDSNVTSISSFLMPFRGTSLGSNVVKAGTIPAWGVQLEEGTEASSYIPTTTAAVTRNADVLSNNLTSVLQPTYTAFIEITANDSRLKVEDVDTGFDIPLNGTGKIVMVVDSQITFYFPDNGQPQTTLIYEKPDDFRELEILSKLNSNSIKLLAIENGVATQTEINNFVSGDITSYFIETDWGSETNFTDEFRGEDWDYFPVIDTSNATALTGAWRGNNLVNFPKLNFSNSSQFAFAWLSNNLATFPSNMFDNLTNPSNSCFLNAWDGSLIDAQGVENILVSIDTSGANAPASGTDIDIGSDGSALTTAAQNAKTSLESKGWTVDIN